MLPGHERERSNSLHIEDPVHSIRVTFRTSTSATSEVDRGVRQAKHYQVRELTRQDAERYAFEAIEFALEEQSG
jgi:hypothetical protein